MNMAMDIRVANVNIDGMTCMSCVKNIEETLGAFVFGSNLKSNSISGPKDGILQVKVNLAGHCGRVVFRVDKWTAKDVAEAIDDMGYDCVLIDEIRMFDYLNFTFV
jgi:copper chaperone CopZ